MTIRVAKIVSVLRSHGLPQALSRMRKDDAAGRPPANARAAAPVDLTGYWVPFISEEWRYRMVMPLKGDYRGIPLTPEGTRVANSWNPAAPEPEPCKAYGAPAIMRIPGRLHVRLAGLRTALRLDTDAGTQTRAVPIRTRYTRVGPADSGRARRTRAGSLPAAVPHQAPDRYGRHDQRASRLSAAKRCAVQRRRHGDRIFRRRRAPVWRPGTDRHDVVEDPQYLQRPYIVSSHFKKERMAPNGIRVRVPASW
jgi:hypothetical protein